MASLFNRGPGKVSNKQRGAEASGSLWKMYSATRGKLMGVTESPLDDEVKQSMDQLKTTKAEFNAIIGGARGMITANKTAQQSSEYLIEALKNSGSAGDSGPWSDAAKGLGTVITSCQAYNVSMWDRVERLVDQLAAFFDEDIVAAKTLKDQYKQAKFDYDSAETAFNKATNEKRSEKERLRNEKRQKAEQMRTALIECVRRLEEKKNRDMTHILHEYFECLSEYHEQANHTCTQSNVGDGDDGAPAGGMSTEKRGSYVFGSASADPEIATAAPAHRYSQPPPPPQPAQQHQLSAPDQNQQQQQQQSHDNGASFAEDSRDVSRTESLVDAGTALQQYPSVEDDDIWGSRQNSELGLSSKKSGGANPFDAFDDDFMNAKPKSNGNNAGGGPPPQNGSNPFGNNPF